MSGIGALLYEIEDGCQPVFYFVKDIPRARLMSLQSSIDNGISVME